MIKGQLIKLMDAFHLRPIVEKSIGCKQKDKYVALRQKKKLFFLMLPNYGNLGDQAIALGSLAYLKKYFSEFEIIEIALKNTNYALSAIKNVISHEDLIVLQGGGNMGNLYLYIEEYRRTILKEFADYRIISMPVTATFTNDSKGRKELERSKRIYNKCKNLTIIAREEKSYDYLKKNFSSNNIVLNPDMAFFIASNLINAKLNRQGVLICLRRDWEMINNNVDDTVSLLFQKLSNCRLYDTYITRDISSDLRGIEVESALREFSLSECVITDRLHAMVMAALTHTPCIVTGALDWKIEGTYQWIKDCPYIRFVKKIEPDRIESDIADVKMNNDYNLFGALSPYFEGLKDKIMQ